MWSRSVALRATGITTYLQNGATIEHAQHDRAAQSAGHESPRTTKLYDRTSDAIRAEAITEGLSLDEIERILIYARQSLLSKHQRTVSRQCLREAPD